ncbi:MAG: PAS domain S-box protein [Bacteroidota bacterium]|nr:PAS domain S-box protein [Bacteroidota bacterium]
MKPKKLNPNLKFQRASQFLLVLCFLSFAFFIWSSYRYHETFEMIGGIFVFIAVAIVIAGLNKNVNLRKEKEAALEVSELRYRNLVENAGAVIFTTDIQGIITFTNQKAELLTGYSVKEIVGKHFSFLVDFSFLKSITENYIQQVKLDLADSLQEFEIITKDGKRKWVEQTAVLIKEEGKAIGFQCVVKDITDKKQLLLELENSTEQKEQSQYRLQAILDNATSLIFIKDLDGKYMMVNKRFKEAFNLNEEDVIGKTDFDFADTKLAEKYKYTDEAIKITRKPMEMEEKLIIQGGEMDSLLVKFPLLDNESKVFGIGGIATDITELSKQRMQLMEAKKEAEDARLMQEQFLANMSHEIRTPMNGIKGMTELLADTHLNDQQKELLAIIKRSVNNLLVVINDILDFSKIKAGKLNIEKIEFDLNEVVENTRGIFAHRLKKKGLSIFYEIDEKIPEQLIGDPYRLNQVLLNLIGNAIKFTEHGSVHLKVSLEKMTDQRAELKFAVSDTGIGIPEDKLAGIFDSFTQVGTDTTRRYGGTGLGLTICKQLVELQDGTIAAHSKMGEGTTIEFTIPYGFTIEEKKGELSVSWPEPGSSKFLMEKNILVVEDNEVNQKLIGFVLRKVGAEVDFANNGEEAIDMLTGEEAGLYDLIIMDIQMPIMDGYTATRIIRNKLKIQTPIIAMTASALQSEKDKCFEYGMNDYMTKPFDFNDLYKRIQKVLGNDLSAAAAPEKKRLSSTSSNIRHYNLSLLEDLHDVDSLIEVITLFLGNTPMQIRQMKNDARQKNWEKVFYSAHKIKGSASMLQAEGMVQVLLLIEQKAGEKKDTESIEEMITQVETSFQTIREDLLAELKRIRSGFAAAS